MPSVRTDCRRLATTRSSRFTRALAPHLACLATLLSAEPAAAADQGTDEYVQWVAAGDAYFAAHPELQGQSGTGWNPFSRIKVFHEQRMHGGELPPAGARWIAVEQKQQMALRSWDQPEWVALGPKNVGGRMIGLAFHPSNPAILYAAATSGGVWKSTDNGKTWQPKTDATAVLGVGGIAVSKTNPSIVVIGTGEGVSWVDRVSGVGILRSTDAGDTWLTTSLTFQVGGGHGFHVVEGGPSGTFLAGASNGLWRSTDGGANWTQVQGPGGSFPAKQFYDAKWQAGSNTVYACQGNAASGNGVYKSTDDGTTWVAGTGQPGSGTIGKTKLAVSEAQSSAVYALYGGFGGPGADTAALYRSTDSGATWTARQSRLVLSQTWYNLVLASSPSNAASVFFGGRDLYRSTDGGSTFAQLSLPAGFESDHHALTFEPRSSSRLWDGNDHGICRSTNAGTSWTTANAGLVTTQFYDVAVNNGPTPYWVLGGAQDNSTRRWPGSGDWLFAANTGDGTGAAIDAVNGTRAYSQNQGGRFFYRSTDSGQTFSVVWSTDPARFVPAFSVDPANGAHVYRAVNVGIRKTTDAGVSWSTIAPQNAISVSISPATGKTAWWVDKNGVYRTTNDGGSWQTASAFGFTVGDSAREILAHPTDANTAFVTFSSYATVAHVVRTTNLGSTWADVTGNLPPQPVNAIAINPSDTSEWFIGADTGVYRSTNGGTNWTPFGTGLPNALIADLEIQSRLQRLVAGTYGRGAWEASLVSTNDAVPPGERTVARSESGDQAATPPPLDEPLPEKSSLIGLTPNPGRGETVVRFTVGRSEKAEVRIAVYDVSGRRVAQLLRGEIEPGWREVSWKGLDEKGNRVATGIYFIQFLAGDVRETRKVVQLR